VPVNPFPVHDSRFQAVANGIVAEREKDGQGFWEEAHSERLLVTDNIRPERELTV
jgi:hypothetical protein